MSELEFEALQESIDKWYSRWHRFAEEDEEPPEHMKKQIAEAEQLSGWKFNCVYGTWRKP